MIKLLKNRGETAIRVLIAMSLILMVALLLESYAGTTVKTQADPISTSDELPLDKIVFDGQGTLDSINPFVIPDTEEGRKNFAASLLVIIDGTQQQFSPFVKLHHYLPQPVTEDDIKPGVSIGYIKDPVDMISELWILKPVPKKDEDVVLVPKKSLQPTKPISNSNAIKNEGGVWKN